MASMFDPSAVGFSGYFEPDSNNNTLQLPPATNRFYGGSVLPVFMNSDTPVNLVSRDSARYNNRPSINEVRNAEADRVIGILKPGSFSAAKQLVNEFNTNMGDREYSRAAGAALRGVGNIALQTSIDMLRPAAAAATTTYNTGSNFLGGLTGSELAPTVAPTPAPMQQNTAPRGNGIVSNADVIGTYMPPRKAGDVAGSPIEIVRGLQRTSYLPVLDAQGRVSYQSEDFMKQKAAEQTAAKLGTAKTTAEIDKLLGEAQKARTPSANDTAINTYLGLVKNQYEPMLKSPDENVRTQAVTEYRNAVADVIAKFGSDALIARLFGGKTE